MSKSDNLKLVGKVTSIHGLKGEIVVTLFAKECPWLKKLKNFVLVKNQNLENEEKIVFTVEKAQFVNSKLKLLTKEMKDRTQAEAINKSLFYIDEDLLQSQKGERIFLKEILDFAVIHENKSVGKIIDFSSNGVQDLLVVKVADSECLIPFVEDFIDKIDFDKKQIHMHLPEGLLEINQGRK